MAASNNVPSNCTGGSFLGALNCGSGVAADSEGQTALTLLTTLVASGASFGAQFAIFLLLRQRLSSIYRPRSYLVPENERVPPPPPGIFTWLPPLFNTPNLAFIQKCGLDAYFFLRYLRLLLKIFVPCAVIVLPILLPINNYSAGTYVGLNKLAIGNVAPQYTGSRLWAHLVLAIAVILWVCYVVYRELRGYIRVRQAYLTSPQHRIRASATTVLVTGIPRKWLTIEALNGLYDVFPGGIRNIWINRNYDELADKVSYRNSLAESLEDAETNLIKMCRKSNERAEEQRRKEEGRKEKTKKEVRLEREQEDAAAQILAQSDGVSAGDQHDHPQTMQDVLDEAEAAEQQREELDSGERKRMKRFGMLGDGLGAIGQGFEDIGKGVGKIGRGIDTGIRKAADNVDQRNLGKGFVDDDELYRPRKRSDFALDEPPPPSPPPKTPFGERQARLQQMQMDGSNGPRDAAFQDGDVTPTSTGMNALESGREPQGTPTSQKALNPSSVRVTGPSTDSKRISPFQIEDPLNYRPDTGSKWKFWQNNDHSLALPSPRPHTADDDDEFPLALAQTRSNASRGGGEKASQKSNDRKWTDKLAFWKRDEKSEESEENYPDAFQKDFDEDQDGNAYWRRYIEPKERETMRIPIFSPTWCPSLPLLGKKVDRIYYLRRELARLNLEIEMDQASPEKFPYMNSAFIQFNHQVAAHMACQSVSHHIPQHMAPRLVEISPDDVLWSNMSTVWWERYLRTTVVLIIAIGLIILYAIPVTFASLLSNFSTLARLKPFSWIEKLPTVIITALQGVVGPAFLGLILTLIPIIFRVLVQQQGVPTGTTRELGVQQWYFAFLFIQVFLVVSIAGGITVLITSLASNPASIVSALGKELPKASNYFFYYLLVQALSASASGILQIGSLVGWFILGPLLDSTARAKWRRQTTLQNVTWGTFYPPFTNFAVIGLVYSVIAPLILVFMLIIVGLFWVVYRYNVLYVFQFRNDTGGLLFPTAVNQLFVGVYTMELCLIGFFFVARDAHDEPSCIPQAIIMIVALVFTILYQWLMNSAFQPLLRYLPITLEDEAVMRDEEFARAQASKFSPLAQRETDGGDRDIKEVLQDQERRESEYEDAAAARERRAVTESRRNARTSSQARSQITDPGHPVTSPRTPRNRDHLSVGGAQHTWHTDRWRQSSATSSLRASDVARIRHLPHAPHRRPDRPAPAQPMATEKPATADKDIEAQNAVGDALFSGFADELEDLTPDERDLLVRYAFQHAALRAKRPVVWIPRDKLGVSDDEIARAERMSTVVVPDDGNDDDEEVDEKREGSVKKGEGKEKTNIWMSNEGTALDGEGNVVFRSSPPDFSNVDLIAL